MSDTFFTASPHWTWFIIPYFFVGGLAGGAYFLAATLEWFGRPEDRPVIRTAYSLAFWGVRGADDGTVFGSTEPFEGRREEIRAAGEATDKEVRNDEPRPMRRRREEGVRHS